MLKPKRQKKCKAKGCNNTFSPMNSMQKVCSPGCALKFAKEKSVKEFNAETRKRKRKLKTRQEWLKEAQAAFNAYIRMRDKGRPCISCDKPDDGTHQRHASHFRSVGAAPHLRFHPLNVHASCKQCNSDLSGNQLEYLKRLPNKIGAKKSDWLVNANYQKRYTIEQAKRIKKIYTKKERLYKSMFRY